MDNHYNFSNKTTVHNIELCTCHVRRGQTLCLVVVRIKANPFFLFQEINKKIKELSDQKNMTEVEKQQVMDEKGDLIKTKTKLELDIRDLEEGVNEDINTRVKKPPLFAIFFTKSIHFVK